MRPPRAFARDVLATRPARRRPNSHSTCRQPPHGGVGLRRRRSTTATASIFALSRRDHRRDGVPLGADRERVARVLDVHAGERSGPRRAARRRRGTRCTARSALARPRVAAATQLVQRRVARPRSLARRPLRLVGRASAVLRVMRTFAIRRPWTSSAVNVSPGTPPPRRSSGSARTGRASGPPTVSHSSSGSSTSSSSFTSSIEALPETRYTPVAHLHELGLLAVVLVGDLAHELLQQVLERDQAATPSRTRR